LLFEIAVATVPANGNALVEAVSKGELILPEHVVKSLGLELKPKAEPKAEPAIKCDCWVWDDPQEKPLPMPTFSRSWKTALKGLDNV
jgi:hypothetical protein